MDKVPPGTYKYENKPTFVTWPKTDGKWHIWGPEDQCLVGDVVEIEKFTNPRRSPEPKTGYFEILSHVADRVVKRRDGSNVRFVMCTFDDTVRED